MSTMSSQDQITLFDLPTKKPEYGCWSPNVWKTRLVLNYKNLSYTTTWLGHSNIAPTLSAVGLAPNDPAAKGPPSAPYTLPAIRLPDGSYIMDSIKIADKLEELHPSPPLHLENRLHLKAQQLIGQASFPLLGVIFPRIGRDILLDEEVEEWKEDKEKRFGMSMDELEKSKGGEVGWKAAEPGLKAFSEFLRESKKDEGPFLLGKEVCYGDFVVAGMLESLRRIGEDVFERMVRDDEGLRGLWEGVRGMGLFKEDR